MQRRASNSGVVMVVGQKNALGRVHAGKTVAIDVTDTQLAIHCDDGTRTVRRTTDKPVTFIKAHRPRKIDRTGAIITRPRRMMATMDRFEGRCWLDWWANSTTNLGGSEISMVITPTATGWEAHGHLLNDNDRVGLTLLCDLDPVFTLRFQDGSTLAVTVTPSDDHHRFTLTEYTGPAQRQINHRIDL